MGWMKVCRLDELQPGDMREYTVNGVQVLVVQGKENVLLVPPSCPHMQNPLCEGFFDGETLSCNKHLWQWSVATGEAVGEAAECALLRYETRQGDGHLWAKVDQALRYPHELDPDGAP